MEIKELLKKAREIWGDKRYALPGIIVRMGKILEIFVDGKETKRKIETTIQSKN
jgi:hypothetical protein